MCVEFFCDCGSLGKGYKCLIFRGQGLQLVRNPPAMWETWVRSLGWEVPLEEGKATHSSTGLENPMGCIVHGVSKSWTQLSALHSHSGWGEPLPCWGRKGALWQHVRFLGSGPAVPEDQVRCGDTSVKKGSAASYPRWYRGPLTRPRYTSRTGPEPREPTVPECSCGLCIHVVKRFTYKMSFNLQAPLMK